MAMSELSRRSFVASSALSASRVIGANDRIRLGIIGTGGRGTFLMREATKEQDIEWVAVSDAWDERRDKAASLLGGRVAKDADYRALLDRKDIDAVIVATWDCTHAVVAADACRAGKDVYVEKPMTSRPEQGPPLVKVVDETKRIVQTGVQQRSTPHFAEAKERFIDSKQLGEIHMVRTIWNANTGYIEKPPAGMEQKPAGLDWNACLGSLPKMPWDPKRYFNRFSYVELNCGQTGGLFVHMIDVVQWYLGIDRPKAVSCLGGIYQYNDGRTAPDNVNAICEYPSKLTVTFEASVTDLVPAESADIVFLGSGGRLHIFRYGYRFLPKGARDLKAQIAGQGTRDTHMRNWLGCVRSRKQPAADVRQGHYAAMVCHMANLAYERKAVVGWDSRWDV